MMRPAYLIKPRWPYPCSEQDSTYNRRWFPLSLAYCSSLLKREGFQVHLYDFHARRELDVESELSSICSKDLVFISTSDIDRWQCPPLDFDPVLEIAKIAREKTSEVYVLGPHGTIAPDLTLRLTQAKAVVRGEPEMTVPAIATSKRLDSIAGLSFLKNGKIYHTPARKDIYLDGLPTPDFSWFRSSDYSYEILGNSTVLLETSRNCRYRCSFCLRTPFGAGFRLKSWKKVIDEIHTARTAGAERGIFIDLDFGASRHHLRELCAALRKGAPGFEWCCSSRVDTLDEEALSLMASAGCRLIHLGIESANPDILKQMKKNVDIGRAQRILDLCSKYEIRTLCFFILGFHGESIEDARQTIELATQLDPTYVSFHLLTTYRGTELFDSRFDQNNFHQECRTADMTRHLKHLVRRAYRHYYMRPSVFIKHLHSPAVHNPLSALRFYGSFIH